MYTKEQIALQTFLVNGLVSQSNQNFARSLAFWNRGLSERQIFFLLKIIQETLNPAAKQIPNAVTIDTLPIHTLFTNALKHLKYPKINLKTKSGANVRFSVSKNDPNTVHMNAGGYGTPYFGKILSPGQIDLYPAGRGMRAELTELIKDFAADPAGFSAAQGKLNHSCVYCSKGLTTNESLAVGYGPECAKHYGLPWGKFAPVTKPTRQELVNDEVPF